MKSLNYMEYTGNLNIRDNFSEIRYLASTNKPSVLHEYVSYDEVKTMLSNMVNKLENAIKAHEQAKELYDKTKYDEDVKLIGKLSEDEYINAYAYAIGVITGNDSPE